MSGFFTGIFGGATDEEKVARLAAEAEASHDIVELGDKERPRAHLLGAGDDDLRSEVGASRPPDFLENIYPSIPQPREFAATEVWERSDVSDVEQENVERAQQLLGGLPPETPDAVKRQIVAAAFKAFDVSIEDIVSAASNEIGALRDYIADANDRAERFKSVSEERIGELEAEIERIQSTMRDAEEEREQLVGSALELIEEVEPVLKFFGNERGAATSGTLPPSVAIPVDATHLDSDVLDDVDVTAVATSHFDKDGDALDDAGERIN